MDSHAAQHATGPAVWLITGCSSGLGRAIAESAVDAGHRVVATARRPDSLDALVARAPDRVLAVPLEVTDPSAVHAAVAEATRRFGGVDVLVNNAGYGYRAAVEEGDPDDVDRLFATHVTGPVSLIKAVLPAMRARRSGCIVNVSSIGVQMTPAGSGYYAAAKAALEALTGSLRVELAPLGIRAFVVEPGSFRTDFAGRSLTQSGTRIADYEPTLSARRVENDRSDGRQPGDPQRAARLLVDVVDGDEAPPSLLLLGSDAVEIVRSRLSATIREIEHWADRSRATDFVV